SSCIHNSLTPAPYDFCELVTGDAGLSLYKPRLCTSLRFIVPPIFRREDEINEGSSSDPRDDGWRICAEYVVRIERIERRCCCSTEADPAAAAAGQIA